MAEHNGETRRKPRLLVNPVLMSRGGEGNMSFIDDLLTEEDQTGIELAYAMVRCEQFLTLLLVALVG